MAGLGVDAVDVERFRHSLSRTPGLAERLFTPGELAYAEAKRDPAPSLAARFAAKEAVMKALGVGLGAFGFHDVEVVRADSGEPSLVLRGRAAELAGGQLRLSLTHTAITAIAVVTD
jgi:holo-[acyl-carrier protein] synthase